MTTVPPATDALTNLPPRNALANGSHASNNLMAGNNRAATYIELASGRGICPAEREEDIQTAAHDVLLGKRVGKTHAARFHLHKYFTLTRMLELRILQGKRSALLLEDSLFVCLG